MIPVGKMNTAIKMESQVISGLVIYTIHGINTRYRIGKL